VRSMKPQPRLVGRVVVGKTLHHIPQIRDHGLRVERRTSEIYLHDQGPSDFRKRKRG
jgi:hypothetical protein